MRIANKAVCLARVSASFAVVLGAVVFSSAYAAETTLPAVPPPSLSSPMALPLPAAPALETAPLSGGGSTLAKSAASMEERAVDNAKSTIKKLDGAADTTSFADLNAARQAITRVEAMIDLEKRLAELEKLRGDRGRGGSASSLASAIPASALAPLPRPVAVVAAAPIALPEPTRSFDIKPAAAPIRGDVTRIFGSDGHYTAVLKMSNGEIKTVHVGDRLSGDEVVKAITTATVLLDSKTGPITLRMKNSGAVYSAMR